MPKSAKSLMSPEVVRGAMSVKRVELEDVDAVVPARIGSDGRISGLGEFAGRRALVVVPSGPAVSTKGKAL